MPDPIEFHTVDALGAGAVGVPGQRVFYLQARSESALLTVLLEKEQVALLAAEAVAFLDRIAEQYPEEPVTLPATVAELHEPTVPLFRARLIGLGFDPEREMVLIELRENATDDEDEDLDDDEDDDSGGPSAPIVASADEDDGYVARIYATRSQVRAMAARGAGVVSAGRPPCDLCGLPMDPAGHRCPRWN
jgi:uncharacterized repeat protein (TIGR03847 family)